MTPAERKDLADAVAAIRGGAGLTAVEVHLQVSRIGRAGILVTAAHIEAHLGHPLAEASHGEMRGVIAALNAVNRSGVSA